MQPLFNLEFLLTCYYCREIDNYNSLISANVVLIGNGQLSVALAARGPLLNIVSYLRHCVCLSVCVLVLVRVWVGVSCLSVGPPGAPLSTHTSLRTTPSSVFTCDLATIYFFST